MEGKGNTLSSSQNRNYYNNNQSTQNNNNSSLNYNSDQPYDWKGRNESFGLILALICKKYEFKYLFYIFVKCLKNHAIQRYTHGNDIVSLIENYKYPKDEINALVQKNPRQSASAKSKSSTKKVTVKKENNESSDDDEQSQGDEYEDDVQKLVIKELVKNHIHCLTKLDMNKMKLYMFDLGSTDYRPTRKITVGIYERANKYSIYATAFRQVFTVRQRENETNDTYRKRFESPLLTLGLVGEKHVMSTSPDIMKLIKANLASAADILAEELQTKAMMLILGADQEGSSHCKIHLKKES